MLEVTDRPFPPPWTVAKWALAIIAAVLLLVWLATRAVAHHAITGWEYSTACCSGHDCSHIPERSVTRNPDGSFTVSLEPGEHPMVRKRPVTVTYTPAKVRRSLDGYFHACIGATGHPYCLYKPDEGF